MFCPDHVDHRLYLVVNMPAHDLRGLLFLVVLNMTDDRLMLGNKAGETRRPASDTLPGSDTSAHAGC